ncbi:MAG: polymerase sigma factor [Solirubrobacterales bacterium]|nr:polymerase sigma factor [Solirubrobacterales bacterium]
MADPTVAGPRQFRVAARRLVLEALTSQRGALVPLPDAGAGRPRPARVSLLPLPFQADDLDRLYRQHARAMLRYFTSRVYDPEVGVDLLGETFAAAYADRARCRGASEEQWLPWVWGIARHQLAAWARRGAIERRAMARLGVERRALNDEEFDRIIDLAESEDLRRAVAARLGTLPADQREAVRLRVLEERSYEDVARAMGVGEATARARVSRGLRALATLLDDDRVPGKGEARA